MGFKAHAHLSPHIPIYRNKWAANGIKLLSASDNYIDPDSESGTWITGLKEIKAEVDLAEIARRTRRGQKAKAKDGYSIGGPMPLGYKRNPLFDKTKKDRYGRPLLIGVKYEIEPSEAQIVRIIFNNSGLF